MSALASCETYRPNVLDAAIRDLTFDVYWPDRLALLLAIKRRREIETKESEDPEQYCRGNRGCKP